MNKQQTGTCTMVPTHLPAPAPSPWRFGHGPVVWGLFLWGQSGQRGLPEWGSACPPTPEPLGR